ncbi:chitinase-like protein C25A8.4 [Belonocnema kinseyi]|uniref:chitinase-like protein C25A8.4 n=1 Tax=Belonocnema kinseyi TaxID=2817044 RepID=UPI00143D4D6C|nr:chitinase-like protein C25A8.4 [Belonocnema kinseyi]
MAAVHPALQEAGRLVVPLYKTMETRWVFLLVAADTAAKAWLYKAVVETRPWEDASLKVVYVELPQKMVKMHKLILFLGICAAFVLGNKLPEHTETPAKDCGKIVGCFYQTGHPNGKGYALQIKDIDVSLCTYIYYALVKLGADASVDNRDAHAEKYGGLKDFNDLRKKHKNLKLIGTMGDIFTVNNKLLTDESLREKLANNVYDYVIKYGFSGMDIDHSDLPQHGGNPPDKKYFVLFLKALKKRFDKKRLILSVSATPYVYDSDILYDVMGISKYVNFINLQTFIFHANDDWTKASGVGHSTPMYQARKENAEDRKLNIDYVVKYWMSKGAPANKLILGTAYTTLSYTLANPKQFGRGAPFTKKGKYDGFIKHLQLCNLIKKWTYFFDPEQKVPYIHHKDQIIAYDNVQSIKVKAQYVKDKHLAGAMVFEIGDDDFSGDCGEKFPFLKTLNQVLQIVICGYQAGHPNGKGHVLRIEDIDLSLCTYVYYAYVKLGADASVDNFDAHAEKYGGIKEFNDLRKQHNNLTLIGRMGGINVVNNKLLTDMPLREKLVNNVYEYVKKYGLSGMDIDHSNLPRSARNPSDKENFVLFLKALKKRFDKERLILSVSVTSNVETADILYDMKEISKCINFINLMTINFHSNENYEKPTGVGHFSAMYQSRKENAEHRKRNIDNVVKYYIGKGAPANKLILGTAYTTVSYTLANPKKFGRGAPFTKKGKYNGFITHLQLCNLVKKWTYFFDPEQKVPYIHQGDQCIAYEDVRSIKLKAEYVQDKHLAGAMVLEIGDDDFSGECGEKFSLLKTLNQMLKFILFLGICSAFASGRKLPEADKQCEQIVGCYYAGGTMDAIYGSLCTHMFYSYVGIGKDATVKIIDPYADIEKTGFKRFNDLRKKSPNLKTLASLGDRDDKLMGITDNDSPYRVFTNPNLRENLVNNIFTFVKKYGFSGIDLDLTNRPQSGGNPSDKENLVLSLKAVKEKFEKEGLILSVLVDPNEATAKRFYDIKGISTYVNFINLKTFDFHEISNGNMKVGHISPLYPSSKENAEDRKKNIDYVVKYWISELATPEKLILGTFAYGKSFTLADPKQIGIGAPLSAVGSYKSSPRDTKEYLLQEYYNICPLLKYPEWKRIYDKEQQVPYIYCGKEIIAYDDADSIKTKAVYAKNMKLGGAMIWSVDEDDFSGVCGEKFPLLNTLNRVLRSKF